MDDMDRIPGRTAPWTDDEVASLRLRQSAPFHEYTCRNDSTHGPLAPTTDGWVCGRCDYRDGWALEADTQLTRVGFEAMWRSLGQEPPPVR
jgi:hypothetical protein